METDIRQARIRDWEPQLRTAPARGELTGIAEMAQAVPLIPGCNPGGGEGGNPS